MTLDVGTLLVINAANLLLMASTLPIIMGRRLSPAAASARAALIVHATGWIAIIVSSLWKDQWPDLVLSTLSMTCTGVSQALMFRALQGWLGPRRGQRLLWVLVVLTPLGYALSFQHYAIRVGWANLLVALELLVVCQATLRPTTREVGNWRWVIFACTLVMAGFTAARGVMGFFFTELYPTFRTPHPVNVLALLATNITLVLGNLAVLVAWREEAEAQLREQAYTDHLTGLYNRHGWEERAPALFAQALRYNTPLALLMLDLDHFKRINDLHGHDVGDAVLRLFGGVLRDNRRGGDLVARIGGEEFVLLLPQSDHAAAVKLDRRLRRALESACAEQPLLAVDFSAGLALLRPDDATLSHLMVRADNGLYQAKNQGRGRLCAMD